MNFVKADNFVLECTQCVSQNDKTVIREDKMFCEMGVAIDDMNIHY